MTKEEYIQIRNSNQLPVTLAFEYYQMKSGDIKMQFDQFNDYFISFVNLFNPDFKDLFHYYDTKFELTFLTDTKKGITWIVDLS